MSYDIELTDPITGQVLEADTQHQLAGGTYALGGTKDLSLNVTYNYAGFFQRVIPDGIRGIYDMTGAESIPILKNGIAQLGDDVNEDYWLPTEGNAKRALTQLLALAQMRPDGIWKGD